jgi:protein-disulfide isomerase/serine/threonine protein kinase
MEITIDPLSLTGQTLINEYLVVRGIREDDALVWYLAQSKIDGGEYTLIVSKSLEIHTASTFLQSAQERISRQALGIKNLHPIIHALRIDTAHGPRLCAVRRGSPGTTVLEMLKDGKHLPENIADFLQPLADTLHTLHDLGMLHGCLSPAMVQVTETGVIADFFGLSSIAEAADGSRGAQSIIPMAYRPPELSSSMPTSPGPWNDIYSFALIIAELLSGEPNLRLAVEDDVDPTPQNAGTPIPDAIDDLLASALQASPSKRPLDPRDLILGLRNHAHGPCTLSQDDAEPAAAVPFAPPPDYQMSLPAGALPAGPAATTQVIEQPATSPYAPPPHKSAPQQPVPTRAPATEQPSKPTVAPLPAPSPTEPPPVREKNLVPWMLGGGVGLMGLAVVGGSFWLLTHQELLRSRGKTVAPVVTTVPGTGPTSTPPSSPPSPTGVELADLVSTNALVFSEETQALIPNDKHSAILGDREAKVTLTIFGDLTCPFTKQMMKSIRESSQTTTIDPVRVVWKHFPKAKNEQANMTAEASIAVRHKAGNLAFWKFAELVFAHTGKLTERALEDLAVQAGVTPGEIVKSLRSHEFQAEVKRDQELAILLGIRGTPVVMINGAKRNGFQSKRQLLTYIVREQQRSRKQLSSGTNAKDLYTTRVLKNITTAEGESLFKR